MQEETNSYHKILIVNTHIAFICYTTGYVLGMKDYFSLGYNNLGIQDLLIVISFVISYILFLTKKIHFRTAVKLIAIFVVTDLLYPGIILFSHVPSSHFFNGDYTIYIILVFIIAFLTNKKFSILINILTILLLTINVTLFTDRLIVEALPRIVLFIGGTGIFGIIFNDLIIKLLKQANESKNKIQELSDWKQDITRNVIHDLKVPVSAILNLSSAKENSSSERIFNQALDINKQLEKILDIERLQEPNLKLNMESVSVNHLIEHAMSKLKTLAIEKNISILPQYNATGKITCDIDLIERLVVNILANAIKYSKLNCQIEIIVDRNNSNCLILVKDYGIGISEEHLHHVFEKFYSVTNEHSKNSFSTGLGLAFCKLVTDVHKGDISITSEIDKGTIVKISLPNFIREEISIDASPISPEGLSFEKDEREFLFEICKQIKDIPIYRASEIIKATQDLEKSKSKNVQNWHERLTDAIYLGNEKLFKDLINLCKLNEK